MTNKRVVIFGCGYVGTAVALRLAAQGARVTALTRNAASAVVLREQAIETVVADLASAEWHAAIRGEPEFGLNCVSSGGGGTAGYRHSYLEGMRSILTWARRSGGIGTLVYTSSTSVYPHGHGVSVDENAAVSADAADEAAQLLVATENELRAAGAAVRRWFILRLAGIYGPGRHHLLDQVRAGEVSGNPEVHLNLIHRDDIVEAVTACFSAPSQIVNEVFNVTDGAPAAKGEVATWLAGKLGQSAPKFSGAAGPRRRFTADRRIANRKLVTMLGWHPRFHSYRDGYAAIL